MHDKSIDKISVLIYVKDRKELWELRDLFYEFEEKLECKFDIFLTCNLGTAFNMFIQSTNGIDIFISKEIICDECEEAFKRCMRRFSHQCHRILKKRNRYQHIYNLEDGMNILEDWKDFEYSFKTKLPNLIKKIAIPTIW